MSFLGDKPELKDKPELELVGKDGNAFMLLGLAQRCFRKNKEYYFENNITWDEIMKEATSNDYNHTLVILMYYFNVS